MKIKINTALKNLDGAIMGATKTAFVVDQEKKIIEDKNGNPLQLTITNPDEALTVKEICKLLLFFEVPGEKKEDDYQTRKFNLGMKILQAKQEADLEAKEITMLQELAKLKYSAPIISIQFCKILDGKKVDFFLPVTEQSKTN